MSRKYTIYAVDFDGTLCESVYPGIGRPNFALIHHLKKKKAKGNILILWTCRCGESLQAAVDWCKDYGLEFDYINENVPEMINEYGNDCRKIFADVYIDDKAVNKPKWNVPCKDPTKNTTNIEYIKSMSFSELVKFIESVHNDGAFVEAGRFLGKDTVNMFGNKDVSGWLRSEVDTVPELVIPYSSFNDFLENMGLLYGVQRDKNEDYESYRERILKRTEQLNNDR